MVARRKWLSLYLCKSFDQNSLNAKAPWNILAEIRADLAINYRAVHRREEL